ncbi:MAG: hypothetical protein P8Y91_10095 [Desulfuromonadales bacterium]|jgi:hypothetical protein
MTTAEENIRKQPNPPARDQRRGASSGIFTVLSVLVALLLIIYGITLLAAGGNNPLQIVFGCVTIGYALLALGALLCAVRTATVACVRLTQAGAIFYLLFYVLVLVIGVNTLFGPSGILLVALALWCNWIAVHKLIRQS